VPRRNEKTLCFYFNRRVTDDEMRHLHAVIRQAAAYSPIIDGQPSKQTTGVLRAGGGGSAAALPAHARY
jgi:hypothetical protein